MDIRDVPGLAWTFLLTGMFFVIGMVILGSFQTTTTTSVTQNNESFTYPAANGTINLVHYRVNAILLMYNSTNSTHGAGNFTITGTANSTVQFLFNATGNSCWTGKTCYVTYTYNNYDTSVPMSIQSTMNAMSEIPNNWLTLLAVIIAATVIIGIVVNNLGGISGGRS